MVSVGVVGGGTAGVAAVESALRGAKVTLFELRGELLVEESRCHTLLASGEVRPTHCRADVLRRLGADVRIGTTVKAIDQKGVLRTKDGTRQLDSLVLASGSRAVQENVSGGRRPGIHVLADQEAFVKLGRVFRSYSEVALSGSGLSILEVADRLSSAGVGLTLFVNGEAMELDLCEAIRRRLFEAIPAAGISQVTAKPDRVAGVEKVEAVVAVGAVYPCEALVVIPAEFPNSLGLSVRTGGLGGWRSTMK